MKPIITIILSFFALSVWADDNGKCGNELTWTYVEETKTLTISGSGAMYNNKNALLEEYPWFYIAYDKTEKVVIEDGITSIGDGAFYLFSKLTSIEIPNSVKHIGYGALGRAKVTFTPSGTPVGLYDEYNFDALIGEREDTDEAVTRIMGQIEQLGVRAPYLLKYDNPWKP